VHDLEKQLEKLIQVDDVNEDFYLSSKTTSADTHEFQSILWQQQQGYLTKGSSRNEVVSC